MTITTPSPRRSTQATESPWVRNPLSRELTPRSKCTAAVLVVEDDLLTRRVLHELLESEGYAVHAVGDGPPALAHLASRPVDLLLLDRGLPHVDGLEICRQARAGPQGNSLRIVILTGLGDAGQFLRGFDAGADDYVTKPYGARELLARVRANLRRKDPVRVERRPSSVVDDRLEIDLDEQQVVVDGQRIELGRTEFALLRLLVENAGQVIPFETILTQVWGPAYTDARHYVHLYVTYLRRKIEYDPRAPRYILSERGIGYRFETGSGPGAARTAAVDDGAIPLD